MNQINITVFLFDVKVPFSPNPVQIPGRTKALMNKVVGLNGKRIDNLIDNLSILV
jgi:hypothetical protein